MERQASQITQFVEKALAGRSVRPPGDFYFKGAEGKQVHGSVVKPYGWVEGRRQEEVVGTTFIHGGMSALANLALQYAEKVHRFSRSLGRSVVYEIEPTCIRVFCPGH